MEQFQTVLSLRVKLITRIYSVLTGGRLISLSSKAIQMLPLTQLNEKRNLIA